MIPICGAKAKGTGKPCQRDPCKSGRCHLHGGKRTRSKTKADKLRLKMAPWKHGFYSKEAIEERQQIQDIYKFLIEQAKEENYT